MTYIKTAIEAKELRAYLRSSGLDRRPAAEIARILRWDREAVQKILHAPLMPDLPGEPLFALTDDDVFGRSLPEVRQTIRCAVIEFLLEHPMFRSEASGEEGATASHRAVAAFMGGSGRDVSECVNR